MLFLLLGFSYHLNASSHLLEKNNQYERLLQEEPVYGFIETLKINLHA
ncbi:MAG: hypothetical protein ACI9IP_001107 [Arcticibacterium sp.]|jgi:hypothetical protein